MSLHGYSHSSPSPPTTHIFWHIACVNVFYLGSFFQTESHLVLVLGNLYTLFFTRSICLVWQRLVLWSGLGLKETKQKSPVTLTAFHIGGRTWMAGGKSTMMPFSSINPDYNFEDNVASRSGGSAWSHHSLETEKTTFSERGNAGLWWRMYKYCTSRVINLN